MKIALIAALAVTLAGCGDDAPPQIAPRDDGAVVVAPAPDVRSVPDGIDAAVADAAPGDAAASNAQAAGTDSGLAAMAVDADGEHPAGASAPVSNTVVAVAPAVPSPAPACDPPAPVDTVPAHPPHKVGV